MVLDSLASLGVVHDGVDVLEQDSSLRVVGVGLDEGESSLEIHVGGSRVQTELTKR